MNWTERIREEKNRYEDFTTRETKIYPVTKGDHICFKAEENKIKQFTKTKIKCILMALLKNNKLTFRYMVVCPVFGYFVPPPKNLFRFIDEINRIDIRHIISVGAGNGFFEMILHNLTNIHIEVSDIVPPETRHFPIINYTSLEHIKKNETKEMCAMFVWPPEEEWVTESVRYLREKKKMIIMAGGLYSGCCWNDDLDNEFSDNWIMVYEDWFDTYQGIDVEFFRIYKPL